jgi:TP901 family phage tail tape measure protein
MTRVLETILLGRDQISPVLIRASGSVRTYDQSVTGAMTHTTTVVEGATRRQSTSLAALGAASVESANAQRAASLTVVAARERETAASAAVSAAEQRLAALRASGTASGMRLALAEDNVAQATLRAAGAQQATAASEAALIGANERLAASEAAVTAGLSATTAAAQREQAAIAGLRAVVSAASTAQRAASASLVAARERETAAAAAVATAEQRLLALRELGTASAGQLAAAENAVTQANARLAAAQQARALSQGALTTADLELTVAEDRLAAANVRVTETSGATTLAMRAQTAATGALASANGLLGTAMTPLTAGLGAVALGLGYAAYRGAQFDSAMSAVQAATMATGGQMEDLRDLAIDLGGATQYSAEEAAQGITELAKAGVSTSDILKGGLAGALSLAAAGQLDVADAAEIAATQMTVFNLKGDQTSHVADLLAAGAGKAQGSVQDLALALQYAGVPAAGLGLSIEETTGTLGLFASNGIVGEKAGTAFRGMLVSLTNPSAKARTTMEELNLQFFDAQGNFIGMEGVAGQLQTRLGDLTVEQRNAALATIFGNEAIGAAQTLYTGGAQGVRDWTRNVDDAGFAADQAAKLNDNLRGDLERLGGAFDSAMTTIGAGTQGPLRFLVQTLTSIIDAGGDFVGWISDLPGPLQAAAIAIAAVYIAAGPLGNLFPTIAAQATFAFGVIRAQAAAAGGGMLAFRAGVAAAASAIGGLLVTLAPFAVVGAAVFAIARMVEVSNAADNAREHIDELTKSYDEGRGPEKYRAVAGALQQVQSAAADARNRLDELNNMSGWDQFWSMDYAGDVREAEANLDAATEALDELNAAAGRADTSAAVLGRRYNMTRKEVEEFADAHGIDLSGSLQIVQTDFMRVADSAGLAASAITVAADGAGTGYESFTAYAAALGLSDDATEELRKHQADLGKSFSEFVDPLAAYTGLLDEKTEADKRAAQATADATADSSDSWEDYVTDVGVSFEEYQAQLEEQVAAQSEWRTNMLLLASRVSAGTLEQLQAMGPAGAGLVADLVTRSSAELAHLEPLMAQSAADAGTAMADELARAGPVLSAVARVAGQGVADSLTQQLAAGTITVGQIAAQYGIAIADGVNPVLQSLGQRTVSVVQGAFGFGVKRAEGGPVWGAGTATSDSIPAMLSNGEYVIKASSVARNGVSALDDLNEGRASVARFANGGFASAADVPAIRSTEPFGAPLSTAATAAMQAERDAAIAFLKANTETISGGTAGSGSVGGAWSSIWEYVHGRIPQARINSTYRPGDPGYHGRGKAIDFGFGSGPGGAGSAGLASIERLLYDDLGRNLAEIIYDGLGNSRPDVKNGRDHVYNVGTQAEHRNHVHAAAYANGGLVEPGGLLNPHVRDSGGPLLPGYTYNGLNRPETVVAAAAPGYGTPTVTNEINYYVTVPGGGGDDRLAERVVDKLREKEWLTQR